MTTVFEDLVPNASFGGIEFTVINESKEGGRKTVSHEYVNSDYRYVEDLGELPPKFSMEVIVSDVLDPTTGLTSTGTLQKRLLLEKKLASKQFETLVHPVYGDLEVKATNFSVSSNQQEIGLFRFRINFEQSRTNITASPSTSTANSVESLASTAFLKLNDGLESAYNAPSDVLGLSALGRKLQDIISKTSEKLTKLPNLITSKVSAFTTEVNTSIANIFSIVQTAEDVRSSLESVYNLAFELADLPSDLLDAWRTLIDYPLVTDTDGDISTEQAIPATTISRQERETNRQLLNEYTQLNALIQFYVSAADKEYDTDEELDEIRAELDEKFSELIEQKVNETKSQLYSESIEGTNSAQTDIPSLLDNTDIVSAIYDVRTEANAVFNEKEQNVWKIREVNAGLSSMALTAYRYYGNIDNIDILSSLNTDKNSANFDGVIRVVS